MTDDPYADACRLLPDAITLWLDTFSAATAGPDDDAKLGKVSAALRALAGPDAAMDCGWPERCRRGVDTLLIATERLQRDLRDIAQHLDHHRARLLAAGFNDPTIPVLRRSDFAGELLPIPLPGDNSLHGWGVPLSHLPEKHKTRLLFDLADLPDVRNLGPVLVLGVEPDVSVWEVAACRRWSRIFRDRWQRANAEPPPTVTLGADPDQPRAAEQEELQLLRGRVAELDAQRAVHELAARLRASVMTFDTPKRHYGRRG